MAKSKIVRANQKIAERAAGGYKKIEKHVVAGYEKIENGAVGGFQKIADKFVEYFLTKENESIEEAQTRLTAEKIQRAVIEENRQKTRRKAGNN